MADEQTPAAGPLTAESVKLLKRGAWLLGPDGRARQLDEWGDGGFLTFLNNEQDGYLATLCTFLGRPDQDGWIAWHGGENPVPGVRVDVQTVGTGMWADWLSDQWGTSWLHEDDGDEASHITHFRPHVASPASSSSVAQGDAGEGGGALDEPLRWFLRTIEAAGGTVDSSDTPHHLLNVFCNDRGSGDDTFNLSEQRGYTHTTHDTSFDTSTTALTDKGRVVLSTLRPQPTAAPVSRPGDGVDELIDAEWIALVGDGPDAFANPASINYDEFAAGVRGVLFDLKPPPAAPVSRPAGEGETTQHTPRCWGRTSYSDEMAHCYCKPAGEGEREAVAILKGVGKITGDGWKDTTTKGEVVFVWNAERPSPYAPGQYPRIGNEGWSASTSQYDFTPATADDIPAILALLSPAAPDAGGGEDRMRIAVREAADAVDFFDRVKASSQAEQIAVGRDHWDRLEAAIRAVAALQPGGER